jgi:hypothetical protein
LLHSLDWFASEAWKSRSERAAARISPRRAASYG